MYSKNNKISKRQIFRLLTYDLLGIETLLLPSYLAAESGKNGMFSVLFGILFGVIFGGILGFIIKIMKEGESYPKFLKRSFGTVIGRIFLLFYTLYYLCLGGYSAYIFGHLIKTDLLKEQSFYWIVLGIIGLAVYAIAQGIEGRARVYEILFWFLMIPLFLMLFFAAGDVEIPRLFPLYSNQGKGIWRGAYYSFEIFSLSSFALFLVPYAKKKESILKAGRSAVLFCGGILLLFYGILQGIFGITAMKALEYPAVTLMSMIQIPGGFFQRQDAFMVAVWFFTVFALLCSCMFYATENLKEFTQGEKNLLWLAVVTVVIFSMAVWCYRSGNITKLFHEIFLKIATPLIVIIPLAAGICIKRPRNKSKVMQCIFILCSSFLLTGCSTTELENRNFPLAMGIDIEDETTRISYKFQNLSALSGEGVGGENSTDFYIEDKDFFTGISKYANETNKKMDYNHMKVLILSEDFIEDKKALENFLRVCGKEDLITRNTLLFFAEDASKILVLDKNLDTAIGTYLEELIESREDYKLKDAVTLGDLYNDKANKEQLLLVPVLAEKGGLPVIRNYYAILGGEPKGELSVNEGIMSYLSQGKLKKLAFTLEDGTGISVERMNVTGDFSRGEKIFYHTKICLEVIAENEIQDGSQQAEEMEKKIKQKFETQLKETADNLLEAPGIDITNSFYKLGMCDREKYEEFKGHIDAYINEIQHEFEIQVILLNERG